MQNCFEDTSRPHSAAEFNAMRFLRARVALFLSILGSIPLVLLTPPFQVPDEVQHFYRAYQLSDLQIRAEVQNGVSGGTLPASLPEFVKASVFTQDSIHYPATPQPISKSLKLRAMPLAPSTRLFVPFPGSSFYSPLPYIPQVFGIIIGRALGFGPLYLLYLARICNCLVAISLVVLAVCQMQDAEELIFIVAMLPMSLFLYASASPDATVIACAILFTSLSFSASVRGGWARWQLVTAAVAAAVFCSLKPPYAPLLLTGLVPGVLRRENRLCTLRAHVVLVIVALGATVAWLLLAKSKMTSPLGEGHPSLQLAMMLRHPAFLIIVLARTLLIAVFHLHYYYFSMVGTFGWLSVPIRPGIASLLPLINLVIVWRLAGRERAEPRIRRGLWHLAVVAATAILIMLALYLLNARVGENHITGIQGRYFIPFLLLAGTTLIDIYPARKSMAPKWFSLAATSLIIALQIVATDTTIISQFHVFS